MDKETQAHLATLNYTQIQRTCMPNYAQQNTTDPATASMLQWGIQLWAVKKKNACHHWLQNMNNT